MQTNVVLKPMKMPQTRTYPPTQRIRYECIVSHKNHQRSPLITKNKQRNNRIITPPNNVRMYAPQLPPEDQDQSQQTNQDIPPPPPWDQAIPPPPPPSTQLITTPKLNMEHDIATDEADGSGTQHDAIDSPGREEQRPQAGTYHAADRWHIATSSDEEDNTTSRHGKLQKMHNHLLTIKIK